ncbi:hypothetical protein [Candidatus Avoscillospira sp. LCP25S3_F1]
MLSWVLTFGDKAELRNPEGLREQLGELVQALIAPIPELTDRKISRKLE